jgi:hypothetical protein
LKVVLNFEETVAMRTQDLELNKWKIHKQPSVHSNVLHCWYEYEIHYIIYFQFQVKLERNYTGCIKKTWTDLKLLSISQNSY